MIKNDPIVLKKNERLEHVLKNIVTISKRMERNRTGIALKEWIKSLTSSYYQERVLSWERILNQENVFQELKTLECDILNPDLLTSLKIKFMRKTSYI